MVVILAVLLPVPLYVLSQGTARTMTRLLLMSRTILKGLASEQIKVVILFVRFKTLLNLIQRSKNCHNKVIMSSLLGVIMIPITGNTCGTFFVVFMIPDNL